MTVSSTSPSCSGFEVVGTVLPGLSPDIEPSAQHLPELLETLEDHPVPAVFGETTVSERLAQSIARETDSKFVRLYSGSLGPEGSGSRDLHWNGPGQCGDHRRGPALADKTTPAGFPSGSPRAATSAPPHQCPGGVPAAGTLFCFCAARARGGMHGGKRRPMPQHLWVPAPYRSTGRALRGNDERVALPHPPHSCMLTARSPTLEDLCGSRDHQQHRRHTMQARAFSHIYLPSRSAEESIAFYTERLGFKLLRKYTMGGRVSAYCELGGVLLEVTDGAQNTPDQDGRTEPRIGVQVDDIAEAIAELRAAGRARGAGAVERAHVLGPAGDDQGTRRGTSCRCGRGRSRTARTTRTGSPCTTTWSGWRRGPSTGSGRTERAVGRGVSGYRHAPVWGLGVGQGERARLSGAHHIPAPLGSCLRRNDELYLRSRT